MPATQEQFEVVHDKLNAVRDRQRELAEKVAVLQASARSDAHFVTYKALFGTIGVLALIFGGINAYYERRREDGLRELQRQQGEFKEQVLKVISERPPWLSEWGRELLERQQPKEEPKEEPEKPQPTPAQLRYIERLRKKSR